MALLESQRAYIEAKAYTYDHNFIYYSLILGEPFLKEDFLFFFDGRMLSINTYFLEPKRIPNPGTRKDAVGEIVKSFEPESIYIWGPHPDELICPLPSSWTRCTLSEPNEFNHDAVLLLEEYEPEEVPCLYQSLRYAEKQGIEIERHAGGPITAGHITLLEDFVSRYDLDLLDRVFYAALPTWFITSNGLMFEAWRNGQLYGYVVLDLSLPGLPMCLASFSLRGLSAVMDVLINNVISYCVGRGHRKLVLGHSYREELQEYKRKWGCHIVQDGFWKTILYHPRSFFSPQRYLWMLRVLA